MSEDGIKCSVSGRLQEVQKGTPYVRIFRRDFHLVPPPEASAASVGGWPCVVQSEVFSLAKDVAAGGAGTGTSASSAGAATAASSSASAPAVTAAVAPAAAMGVSPTVEQQQAMVMQLSQATGMNLVFSEQVGCYLHYPLRSPSASCFRSVSLTNASRFQCLSGNEWSYDAAMANFQQLQVWARVC